MICLNYSQFRSVFSTSGVVAADGYEEWPSAELRSGGFSGGLTGVDKPILAFPITVSVDGSANGAAAHNAWLSQRTDVAANQWLSTTETAGKSGSWTIALTATAVADLGLASTTAAVSVDQLTKILKHVYLYVQRQSDDAIQWFDLLRLSLAD